MTLFDSDHYSLEEKAVTLVHSWLQVLGPSIKGTVFALRAKLFWMLVSVRCLMTGLKIKICIRGTRINIYNKITLIVNKTLK